MERISLSNELQQFLTICLKFRNILQDVYMNNTR